MNLVRPLFCLLALLLVIGTGPALALPKAQRYAVAELPTPVLNTPDFSGIFGGTTGTTLKADACGQLPSLEFIALPKTVFTVTDVLKRQGQTIYRVTTDDYPYPEPRGYYVDSRFVRLTPIKPKPRQRELPPREQIIERLLSLQGTPYVWGGNVARGIPQMLLFYPPSQPLRSMELTHRWLMAGVDCSGLLYAATNGYTPRNTTSLLTYGQPVRIANLSADEIIVRVEPLDLIVWKGHVIIIIDQQLAIESKPDCQGKGDGVRLVPLKELLDGLLAKRVPVDEHCAIADQVSKSFVIRRWYGVTPVRVGKIPYAATRGGVPFAAPH